MISTLPLIGAVVFAGVGFGWRSWFHYRRFGHSGLRLFRSGRWAQHLRELLLVLLSVVMGGQAVAYAIHPGSIERLALLTPPGGGPWVALGVVLLFSGVALMVTAQLDLGASWRVGIDEGARPGLVTNGLYRFSRNPIYLAVFVTLAGYLVLLPTWLSLAVLVVSIAGIRTQVVEEERYLQRVYGNEFAAYARRVGRFMPGLGTLAPHRSPSA